MSHPVPKIQFLASWGVTETEPNWKSPKAALLRYPDILVCYVTYKAFTLGWGSGEAFSFYTCDRTTALQSAAGRDLPRWIPCCPHMLQSQGPAVVVLQHQGCCSEKKDGREAARPLAAACSASWLCQGNKLNQSDNPSKGACIQVKESFKEGWAFKT